MDFLLEVIIGILDGSFSSEREYIIDVEKYPKGLVYFVTILYSVFLLAVIGLLIIAGTLEMTDGNAFEGLACLIIAVGLSSIAIRKVVKTIRHIRENKVSGNSQYNSSNQADLHRFYREEWKLRKQYAKKLKIKRIFFLIFTGVLFVGAFIGSTVLRNSIIRASQNEDWPENVLSFLHPSSNEEEKQPETSVELIESVNDEYEITYLSDIRYANEPAEVNPQLISHIDADSRTLYIRLRPGRYNVVPFITVTAYDKNGNKLATGKGSYVGGGDIWREDDQGADGQDVNNLSSDYRNRDDRNGDDQDADGWGEEKIDDGGVGYKTSQVIKITHEGILPIILNIPSTETDVRYSVVCNGGTSLTPENDYREITDVREDNGKLYVTISGSGLEKDIYVLFYKDGAFVNLLSGITETGYSDWKSTGSAEVVFDLSEIEFDTVEVYD